MDLFTDHLINVSKGFSYIGSIDASTEDAFVEYENALVVNNSAKYKLIH